MQRSLSKLEGAIDRLNGLFLGVVENSSQNVLVRHVMGLDIDTKLLNERMLREMRKGTEKTTIVEHILNGAQLEVSLYFTDYKISDECKALSKIRVNRVLKMAQNMLGRTILEVEIREVPFALQIVNTVFKEIVDDSVQTPTEQEVNSFESLPEDLKHIFVEKYAHGRLYIKGDVGGYSPEVILMEKMCPKVLNNALTDSSEPITVKMGWWAEAIKKLIVIDEAGWIHGDCYHANISWTRDVGVGELKWIDPKRMINHSGMDLKLVAAYKLQEIYHILLFSSFVSNRLQGGLVSLNAVNLGALHERLNEVRKRLPSKLIHAFMLPDTIMFYEGFRHGIITPDLMEAIRSHPQYQVMDTIDYTEFLRKLTNIYYLENVYEYLILQMNKVLRGNMAISIEDYNIPTETPSPRMGGQPYNPENGMPLIPIPRPPPAPTPPAPGSSVYPLVITIGNRREQILTVSGEGYYVFSSGGKFKLCVIRNNTPSFESPNSAPHLIISGGQVTFNSIPLFMMVSNDRNLVIGYFDGGSGTWTPHRTFDLSKGHFVL